MQLLTRSKVDRSRTKYFACYDKETGSITGIVTSPDTNLNYIEIDSDVAKQFISGELDHFEYVVSDTLDDEIKLLSLDEELEIISEKRKIEVVGKDDPASSDVKIRFYRLNKKLNIKVNSIQLNRLISFSNRKNNSLDDISFYISKNDNPDNLISIINMKLSDLSLRSGVTISDLDTRAFEFDNINIRTNKCFKKYSIEFLEEELVELPEVSSLSNLFECEINPDSCHFYLQEIDTGMKLVPSGNTNLDSFRLYKFLFIYTGENIDDFKGMYELKFNDIIQETELPKIDNAQKIYHMNRDIVIGIFDENSN
jgi:hypothetical protein